MKIIIIAKIISLLNVNAEMKKEITRCTLYGVRATQNIDIHKRLQECIQQFKR